MLALVLGALLPACGEPEAEADAASTAFGIDLTPPIPAEFEALDPRTALALETLYRELLDAPRDAELRRRYAATLDTIEFDVPAEVAWVQAAALDLADPRARHHLGRLRAAAGDHVGAARAFASAIELEPSYAPTRWRLGLSTLALGRLDEAEAAFEAARELAPRDPSGLAGLARVALERDDVDRAEELLRQALELAPNDGYLPELLARVHRRRGDEAAAAVLLARPGLPSRCFRGDPWVRELSDHRVGFAEDLVRARDLLAAGQPSEALALLEPMYSDDPGNLAVEGLAVRALLDLDQTERAQTILRESLARGDHPRTQVSLGFVHLVRDEHAEALACADRALEAQPGFANAYFLRARALVGLGREAEAVDALSAAFEHGEKSLEAKLLYGRSLGEMGRLDEAVEALVGATERYPASLQAWALRCEAEFRAGHVVEARRSLSEVAARDADGNVLPRLKALLGEG